MRDRVLPVVVGLMSGWATIFLLEFFNQRVYPKPAGVDLSTKEGLAQLVESIPTGAFVLLFASWMVSAIIAGAVTTVMNRDQWRNNVIIAGVVLSIGALINMVTIPHPTWLIIASAIGYVPCTYWGGNLFKEKT